jgi:hypothetical protein
MRESVLRCTAKKKSLTHILDLSQRRTCPCGEVRKIGEQRLKELQSQIEELTRFRDHLNRAVTQWKRCPEEAPAGNAICVLIERTMTGSNDVGARPQQKKGAKWHFTKASSTRLRSRNAGMKSR